MIVLELVDEYTLLCLSGIHLVHQLTQAHLITQH